ncbi:MAG: AAA family ATPase, partial [Gallionella sp.]
MYLSYFGLAEAPFSIAPDPRYLYMSQRHQEALAHLLYGVNAGGGFVLLTGEVGAGKTTVCRCLLEQIPASCDVAYIFNPKLTVAELLSTICAEYGIECPQGNTSVKVYVDRINNYLLAAHARGRHTVLIIDEAQNLSADVLEQLRLLTNLETNQRKLLQIILLGQPELAAMLERPELRQLAQRIIARYHLGPLEKREVAAYVLHRLGIAGAQHRLFPDALMGSLYRLSRGIPRVINVLCDRALLGTYAQSKERVDRATLKQAAREVFHNAAVQPRNLMRYLLAGLILAGAVFAAARYQPTGQTPPPAKTEVNKVAPNPATTNLSATLADVLEWPSTYPFSR